MVGQNTSSRLRPFEVVGAPLQEMTNCAGASGADERIALQSDSSPPL